MEAAPNNSNNGIGARTMWRALTHRNFRLFFIGQGISLVGTWMTTIATSWLVFTGSHQGPEAAAWLGRLDFAGQIPILFITPFAGVLIDRWNKRGVLVVTQSLSLIQSACLVFVAFYAGPSPATVWWIVFLNLFQGIVNAVDMPARQSFVVEMIDRREDLANAIALNSSMFNSARLLGPSVAGLIIAEVGAGWCFVIDVFSYLAVIAALLAMRLQAMPRESHRAPVWHGFREGVSYTLGFGPIRAILMLVAMLSFMGMPYATLMPIFAGDATTYGFLRAAPGVGALAGALYMASRRSVIGLGRTIIVAACIFSVALIGFSLSPWLWLSLPFLALTGFGIMVTMASSNTILQTIVEENKRGRVMSLYVMAVVGMAPLGSLFAGELAKRIGAGSTVLIGARSTVLIGGLACGVAALLFAVRLPRLRSLVRPLYVRMGILPEVATGLQTATEVGMGAEE